MKIEPMLAHSSAPFNSDEYLFEIKFDGRRCVAFVEEAVRLQNRRGNDITRLFPELQGISKSVKARAVLDGEIVILCGGKPDITKLQQREREGKLNIKILSQLMPATYVAFDVLYLNGKPLLNEKLIERKKILAEIVEDSSVIIKSEYILVQGRKFFEEAAKLGFEGVVAKHLNSPYIGGRSKFWLKVKKSETLDAVICGYTKGEGWRSKYFGSLVLGCYSGGELKYVGKVGTGFDEAMLRNIMMAMKPKKEPLFAVEEEVTWVEPELVCEIEFLEVTKDLKRRMPSFKRLRTDKAPEECILPTL